MGRLLLVSRLAVRDLRRRRAEAALLLLAIMAATTTLTLGLVLREAGSEPYQSTRDGTAGPDVIASVGPHEFSGAPADLASLEALADAPDVIGHSGPYPMIGAELKASGGTTAGVWAQGRDPAESSVDQPGLIQGNWLREGGVVVEAGLADALGIGEGDQITVGGRSFQVVGVAVTAAATPYPTVCFAPCHFGAWEPDEDDLPPPPGGSESDPSEGPGVAFGPHIGDTGLVWLTEADARGLAPQAEVLSYVLNLALADPADAAKFVNAHAAIDGPALATWQDLLDHHTNLVQNQQLVLLNGSSLVGILAVASVAVLVGGRMAEQTRRVGLLKAVGGTPGLVAAVLLAEYVVVAFLATAGGLAAGWLAAPLLTDPSASLVGSARPPSLTMSRVGLVTAVAVGVAIIATFVPAVRAARTSTVDALADAVRPPRRSTWLIKLSARLPVPLLLGLRVAGRRPRRVMLGVVSIMITVSGLVAALAARAQLAGSGVDEFELDAANKVLLVITVMLVVLAAVNTVFITWTTALDGRHSSALARALGATPQEVSTGLSAAQVLPALTGAMLGIPGGLGLYVAVVPDETPIPPLWWLLAVVAGTVLVVAMLTTIPARLGARRPVAQILQAEHA